MFWFWRNSRCDRSWDKFKGQELGLVAGIGTVNKWKKVECLNSFHRHGPYTLGLAVIRWWWYQPAVHFSFFVFSSHVVNTCDLVDCQYHENGASNADDSNDLQCPFQFLFWSQDSSFYEALGTILAKLFSFQRIENNFFFSLLFVCLLQLILHQVIILLLNGLVTLQMRLIDNAIQYLKRYWLILHQHELNTCSLATFMKRQARVYLLFTCFKFW
jgi:hypothetical protein